MRVNPDGSLSSPGAARAAALSPIFITDWFLFTTFGCGEDKVMAGGNPGQPCHARQSVFPCYEALHDRVGEIDVLFLVAGVDQVVWKVS